MSTVALPPSEAIIRDHRLSGFFAEECLRVAKTFLPRTEFPSYESIIPRIISALKTGPEVAKAITDFTKKWRKRVHNREERPEVEEGLWILMHKDWVASTEQLLDLAQFFAAAFPDRINEDLPGFHESKELMRQFQAILENWVTPEWALLPNIRELTFNEHESRQIEAILAAPVIPLPKGTKVIPMSREEYMQQTGRV